MARIAGVDLPVQKRLWVGLTAIYGIGQERARKIAAKANVDPTKKIRDLTEDEVNHLRQVIEQEGRVEGDLRKEIQMNIRRLIEIQAYRGIRHRRNLPVRGQRTHTNARTRKGPRRGAVAAKKKWSESWQKNRKPLLERRRPEPRQNRQRRQSAKKNSRRSVSAAPFRTAWCTSPRRSTTRRSPSRTRMGAPCAGPLRARSASRVRAKARLTRRSRLLWPPPAWRATSTA